MSATALTEAAPRARRWYGQLYLQVLVAIVAGIFVGALFPDAGVALKVLGDVFVKLVKMIIAPVIFLTVATGIGAMRDLGRVGGVFGRALVYFLAVSTFALVIGLVVGNIVRPGAGMNIDASAIDPRLVADYAGKAHDQSIVAFLTNIIPTTPFSALADGEILQVLFVAVLFGIAIARVGPAAAPLLRGLEAANKVVFRLVHMLMTLAPIGAFGAMAFTIGQFGLSSLANLAGLVATFYATSILFVVVVLGAIARAAGFSIFALLGYLRQELLLVLGTSSSEAALPSLIEKLTDAGVEREVVGLVLPAGYSFNLDGTNIYMTLASLFIAQAVGVDLSLGDQLLLVLVAMVSSKGAAGVTGAGFVILAATLSVVPSVPVAGMALILGVDRFMSECRALTNLVGNAVATIVVAKWTGALDGDRLQAVLGRGARGTPTKDADPSTERLAD